MPGGKRTKLTAELQKKIIDVLSNGGYFEVACEYAGIDARTGLEWLQRGGVNIRHAPGRLSMRSLRRRAKKLKLMMRSFTIARIKKAGQGGEVIYEKIHRKPDIITTNERWRNHRKAWGDGNGAPIYQP